MVDLPHGHSQEHSPTALIPGILHKLAPSIFKDCQSKSNEANSEHSLHPISILSIEMLTAVGIYTQKIGQAQADRQTEQCSELKMDEINVEASLF